eukprot:4140001-Pyramimonas_sp.AAC.1
MSEQASARMSKLLGARGIASHAMASGPEAASPGGPAASSSARASGGGRSAIWRRGKMELRHSARRMLSACFAATTRAQCRMLAWCTAAGSAT